MSDNPMMSRPAAGRGTVLQEPSVVRAGGDGRVVDRRSYADWSSIFAGAVIASAVFFLMMTFGSGIGLSIVSPEPREGVSAQMFLIATAIWFIWVAVSSFGSGGYVAGRLRPRMEDATADERDVRDGLQGLVVWGAGVVVAATLALSGISSLLGAVGSAAGSAASAATNTAEQLVQAADIDFDYEVDRLLRGGGAQADGAAALRREIVTILGRVLRDGEISQQDRAYLVAQAANYAGITEAEAQQRVEAGLDELRQARATAVQALEDTRIATAITAFAIAATMLISAATAYLAAILGGQHRDQGIFIAGRRRPSAS